MLRCKECKNNYKELVDGLCHRCSPHDIESWFHARDNLIDPDQPKADMIVMQEKIAGLFQTVAAHSNVTFGAFTAINSLIDDLTKDVKSISEMLAEEITRNKELCERLRVLEKHHGMP